MVTTPVAHATFTDLLALLFPGAGTDGYVKVVSEGSQRPQEFWFRCQQGRWLWQRSYAWRERPEPVEQFLAANGADVFFSPLRWSAPALGIPGSPTAAVWCGLAVGTLGPTVRTVTVPRIDVVDAEQVRQRLSEFSPAPSIILHEGDRMVGLWLLTEPLRDLGRLERANRALAGRLGGDYVSPGEALLAVPGTRRTTFLPAPTVEVIGWQPERRYPLDALALP